MVAVAVQARLGPQEQQAVQEPREILAQLAHQVDQETLVAQRLVHGLVKRAQLVPLA